MTSGTGEFGPRRSLGQNFLVDPNTQRRIVEQVSLPGIERIIEIGPGKGALTHGLLGLGLPVVVIEKDRALAARWADEAARRPTLTAVEADALEVELATFGAPATSVVVSNVPYNVTTPLIFHLLERPRPAEMILMVQREVADRIVAEPGSRTYGALSVGVQIVADVERLFLVPNTVFRPRPKVDSAVIRIRPLMPPPLSADVEGRTRILARACFGWRRKQLGTTLRKHPDLRVGPDRIESVLDALGVQPEARAETLHPSQFVALAEQLAQR